MVGEKLNFIQWINNNQIIFILVGIIVGFWIILYAVYGDKEGTKKQDQSVIEKEFKINESEKSQELEQEEGLIVDFFVLMYRTKRLIGFIESLTQKIKWFWNAYFTIGIFVGIGGMVYVFYFLGKNAFTIVSSEGGGGQGVQLIIPGITTPLAAGLIGIMIVMFVHELSHGIAAKTDELNLKSVGLLLLVIIPGAFVEPDEDELNNSSLLTKLKVYAAGSFTNIVIGLIVTLLLLPTLSPILAQPDGIQISGTIEGEGAHGKLQAGDVIVGIDGEETLSYNQFRTKMSDTNPGDEVLVKIRRDKEIKEYEIALGENPNAEGGFLGVKLGGNPQNYNQKFPLAINIIIILNWIGILNLGIGLMNLFPLIPLDGGKMVMEISKRFTNEKIAKGITYSLSIVGAGLLILNIFPGL